MRIPICRYDKLIKTSAMKQLEGNIVDIYNRKIYPGIIFIENGIITSITKTSKEYKHYISPGFIDAHVHIESSMLTPKEFSKLAIQKGTVAIVNDPHEIANVLGVDGIKFMIDGSKQSLIKNYFTIPSCVPSTAFDCSGGRITAKDTEDLLNTGLFIGLSEMMNVPGVLNRDPETMRKIELVKNQQLAIDGHAPGLRGGNLKTYIQSGISTDHECTDIDEAQEKIQQGMGILIREGSAAKNYEALKSLISSNPDKVMFCTDDSHPGDLIKLGHIDKIVRRAIHDKFDLYDVLKIACINPIQHYKLNVGTLRIGESADFVIFDNLEEFNVISTFIEGEERYNMDKGFAVIDKCADSRNKIYPNKFARKPVLKSEIAKSVDKEVLCIEVFDGEIVTGKKVFILNQPQDNFESDIDRDILKIVYINRYQNLQPQIAYIHGVHLKKGAFATSISHDSHNIIAVGCNDEDLVAAINSVISEKGGLSISDEGKQTILPLPIAGIMSERNGKEVAESWDNLIHLLRGMGCTLSSPFMTLSFMALIVIPELKIGERGLFEYSKFDFIS